MLSTQSLQAFLAGHSRQDAEMAAAAYERARGAAAPRVLAYAKPTEARAHGRTGDARAADRALAESIRQLELVVPDGDPQWLSYLTPARVAVDAIEINRDLHRPAAALRWVKDADAMPKDRFTRAVGIRTAVETSTYLQAGELDRGLAMGHRAVDILSRVHSPPRAYLRGRYSHSPGPLARRGRGCRLRAPCPHRDPAAEGGMTHEASVAPVPNAVLHRCHGRCSLDHLSDQCVMRREIGAQ